MGRFTAPYKAPSSRPLAEVVGALNQGHHLTVLRFRERLENALGASHFGYLIY